MKEFTQLLQLMQTLLGSPVSLYDFEVETIEGKKVKLKEYENKVILIVNVASKCKFTPQYSELEQLYRKYKKDGFTILAFPCNQFSNQEPNSKEQIRQFCSLYFNVTFPLFSKIDVNGLNAHELYKHLKNESRAFSETSAIQWNFTKFLIDKKGNVLKRYSSITQPLSIEDDIKTLIHH